MSEIYTVATDTCWKCGRAIKVYTWEKHELWGEDEPPVPRPATIRLIYSKTVSKRYWVNTCQYCGAISGDWFLYCEPGGVFFDPTLREVAKFMYG